MNELALLSLMELGFTEEEAINKLNDNLNDLIEEEVVPIEFNLSVMYS